MTRRVKAIFWDLDDTLVPTKNIDVQAYECVCQTALQLMPGLDEQQLLADWRVLFQASPWDPQHQVDVEEWRAGLWLKALTNQGHASEAAAAAAVQMQHVFSSTRLRLFQFSPDVQELVASLSQQGYSQVVITNGHHVIQRQKVACCEAERLFPHILVGGEEVLAGRSEKPHPSIFERACELAQCQPQEAIHVGDSLRCDVQGGINAGLAATVWVNASGKALPEGSPAPDYVVSNVMELPLVLRALQNGGSGSDGAGVVAACQPGTAL